MRKFAVVLQKNVVVVVEAATLGAAKEQAVAELATDEPKAGWEPVGVEQYDEPTPIEVICDALATAGTGGASDILVPEQCASVVLPDGKCYHVTVEEIKG